VCVVLASGGYPDAYETGKKITLPSDPGPGIILFQAGTGWGEGDSLVTSGGRVMGVTAVREGGGMAAAIAAAYEAVAGVSFDGMHFRHDIGKRALT
jgi:phosphoribosylamine--glycine ligase